VDDTRARQLIREVLFRDPLREWTCHELARLLSLTGRTIAREIRFLKESNQIERAYGKRRRMTFRAKPASPYPRWLQPLALEDVERVIVLSVNRYSVDKDER
jgi:hypothetical protein